MVGLGSLVWWASVSVSGGCCAVVGSGGGSRGAKPRVGGCALCWVGLGSVVVGLGSLVWWASVSVSGGCCVVLCGGGGGRGAKPRVGGCALGVGRCVFRGLGQDFAKMVHFRPSENLENNFRQHVVLLEYLPTRYCCLKKNQNTPRLSEHLPVMGEKMSKRLGGIKGCKYKTSSWHLNGFPYGGNIGSTA